jgi:hypothetical protein
MKALTIKYLAYVFIILQMFAYYGGIPIPFTNVNFSMLNQENILFLITTILGENFFLFIGLILLLIYWLKFRKQDKKDNFENTNIDK